MSHITTKDESIQDPPSNDPIDVEENTTSNVDDSTEQLQSLGLHSSNTGDIKEEAAPEIGDTVNEESIAESPSPDPANVEENAPQVDDAASKESTTELPSADSTNFEETGPKNDDAVDEDSTPESPSPDPTDIEEGKDSYRPGGFHPVYIGDVYADRYKIMNKIGYGQYSKVWLVHDLKA